MFDSKPKHGMPNPWPLARWAARLWMWAFGWKVRPETPVGCKFVIIVEPHTSGWDFPFMLAAGYIWRIRSCWLGKHTLFRKPFGFLMQWLGGIPIDRSRSVGMVEQVARRIAEADRIGLAVAPSGTRQKRDYWKSGFYWIAVEAKIPILCGYLDYRRKEAGLGLCFLPTGGVSADMERIRRFYEGIQGKHPESMSRIRLREEDEIESADEHG